MSLDFYIEAKISDRKTNLAISRTEYGCYFDICYWFSWSLSDIRDGLIEIANSHSGKNYTNKDYKIPIPEKEYKWSDSMAREILTKIHRLLNGNSGYSIHTDKKIIK